MNREDLLLTDDERRGFRYLSPDIIHKDGSICYHDDTEGLCQANEHHLLKMESCHTSSTTYRQQPWPMHEALEMATAMVVCQHPPQAP